MEICCCYAFLGLLTTRSKCKLGDNDKLSSATEDLPPDTKDDSFESLAQDLIHRAINDEAANEAEELLTLSGIAIPSNQQWAHRPARTQIPLATLFDFHRSDYGLDFYWTGAVKNLDAEADACEQAFVQQEGLQMSKMTDISLIASTSSSSSLA
jgi:hypothetical protein